jgi:Base plate wedge protein 53
MSTTYLSSSPYYNTPQVVKDGVSYLGFWKEIIISPNINDTLITLDSQYQYRADLLSNALYGTPQLWWVFMLRNPNVITDPIWDFVTGITIYTPPKVSLSGYL